jgi:hypothetical protein
LGWGSGGVNESMSEVQGPFLSVLIRQKIGAMRSSSR